MNLKNFHLKQMVKTKSRSFSVHKQVEKGLYENLDFSISTLMNILYLLFRIFVQAQGRVEILRQDAVLARPRSEREIEQFVN